MFPQGAAAGCVRHALRSKVPQASCSEQPSTVQYRPHSKVGACTCGLGVQAETLSSALCDTPW